MRLRSIIKTLRTDRNIPLSFLYQKYTYEPLPSPASVRLLKLAPSSKQNVIRCSLHAFELKDAPPFRALSYTWGHSHVELCPASKDLRSNAHNDPVGLINNTEQTGRLLRHSIVCDGRLLKVTSNLRDALRMLNSSTNPTQGSQSPSYYWIDAICMDQSNIAERNDQVARMASVFERATGVVVWLGKEDEFIADALQTMSTIAAMPEDSWRNVPYTSFYNPSGPANNNAPQLSFYNWLGFMVLINRPWFKRAWVSDGIRQTRHAC